MVFSVRDGRHRLTFSVLDSVLSVCDRIIIKEKLIAAGWLLVTLCIFSLGFTLQGSPLIYSSHFLEHPFSQFGKSP